MDARQQRIAKQHLRTDALLGVRQIPLSGEADYSETGAASEKPAAEAAPSPSPSPSPTPSSASAAAPTPTESMFAASGQSLAPDEPMDREAKVAALKAMDENEVRGCTKCELCHGRTQTVFGEGDPDASIMFVGEGPGQSEDEQGRPFVGRAGELLTKMINAMGLDRGDVYIANIVKCRPPNNRAPTASEVDACWDYLRRQMQTIRPKAIITLGGPSTKTLLQTAQGITRLRGTWHEYAGVDPAIPVMPTFHPAYVLRNYTPDTRGKVWDDLQAVLKLVQAGEKNE